MPERVSSMFTPSSLRGAAPHSEGIVCECRGCTTATLERDKFHEEYNKHKKEYIYEALNTQVFEQRNYTSPNKEFEGVLKFQVTAIEEGLCISTFFALSYLSIRKLRRYVAMQRKL